MWIWMFDMKCDPLNEIPIHSQRSLETICVNEKRCTLRILGLSNGGVGTCIAGVRVLKIGTFEGSGYLGQAHSLNDGRKNLSQTLNV